MSFNEVVAFFRCVFARFRACFFCPMKISGLCNFCLLVFLFFCHCRSFFLLFIAYTYPFRSAHLLVPLFSWPWFPLAHHGHPCRLPAFFRRDHVSIILLFLTICGHFPLIFAFLYMHGPQPAYANPCAPIQSQPCIFFRFSAKHDVRGNFPGHRP